MPANRRSRMPFYIGAFLVGALVVGMPLGAAAYWKAMANAPSFSASTATLPVPTLSCASRPGFLGLTPYARISWNTTTGATGYTVYASSSSTPPSVVSSDVSGPPFDLRGNLLSGLSGTVQVTVVAHYGTWTSASSNSAGVVQSDPLLGFLLGGTKCQ